MSIITQDGTLEYKGGGAHLSSTAAGGELIQDRVELRRNLVDLVGGNGLGNVAARDGLLDLVDQAEEGLDGLDHLA